MFLGPKKNEGFQFLFETLPLLLLCCWWVFLSQSGGKWANGLSRLVGVGVASGGFSRGCCHGPIGHQNSVAPVDANTDLTVTRLVADVGRGGFLW